MKTNLYYLIFFISIILLLIIVSFLYAEDMSEEKHLVGGQCEYKSYEGHAKIISITKKSETINYLKDEYEVRFIFTTDRKIEESFAQIEKKEFLLLINNTYNPRLKFLEKYDIKVGKVLDCYLKVIIKGTCTPILFEFPSVMLEDYLED